MRRSARISDADEPLSLNSLLDTLMNVIGVSLILLAAADLSLIRTKKQIEVSTIPRDISRKLAIERANSVPLHGQPAPRADSAQKQIDDDEQRRRLLARLQALEAEAAISPEPPGKLADSRRTPGVLQAEGSELDSKIAALHAEIAKLSTDGLRAGHGTIIELPVRRTIAKHLEPLTVVCRNGQAVILDPGQLNKAFEEALQTVLARLTSGMPAPQRIHEVVSYFDTVEVGSRAFRIKLQPAYDKAGRFGFAATILPRTTAGIAGGSPAVSPEDAAMLRGLDPSKQYIDFLVWADSFKFYLSLRSELEKAYSTEANRGTRIGLSWTPYAMDEELKTFIDLTGSPAKGGDAKGSDVGQETIIDNGGGA
ncbi:MAG TPA: hypothetical protein VMW75_23220 [Thermoanaerobaculia bacterium]|nr:hypothetical protein [Thermoanaerobaculia bacterium]